MKEDDPHPDWPIGEVRVARYVPYAGQQQALDAGFTLSPLRCHHGNYGVLAMKSEQAS